MGWVKKLFLLQKEAPYSQSHKWWKKQWFMPTGGEKPVVCIHIFSVNAPISSGWSKGKGGKSGTQGKHLCYVCITALCRSQCEVFVFISFSQQALQYMSKTICISRLIFTRFLHWLQGSNVNRRLLVTTRRNRQNKLRARELKVILVCKHRCVTSVPRNTCTYKFRIALWGTTLLRLKHIINLHIILGWQIRGY